MPAIATFTVAAVRSSARADALLAAGRVFTDEAGVEMLAVRLADHPELFTAPPAVSQPDYPIVAAPTTGGPGTELKALLKTWLRIEATEDCGCNSKAKEMDARGGDWCENNIDTIVGWLRDQATARGLPFIDAAGRMLVRLAIRNARKNAPPPPPTAGNHTDKN
jgi:hypothetical protein